MVDTNANFIYISKLQLLGDPYSLLFQEEVDLISYAWVCVAHLSLTPIHSFLSPPSGGCRGRFRQLHPRWQAVCRPCCMEARTVPRLRVRHWDSAVWRAHLWGCDRLWQSHHSIWRVLSHLPSWNRRAYRSALCLYTFFFFFLLIISVPLAVCSEFCKYGTSLTYH